MAMDNAMPIQQEEARMKTFTVVYRTGGKLNCEWKRTIPFPLQDEAKKVGREIERGGRKALIFDTAQLNSIGMPVGWDALSANY